MSVRSSRSAGSATTVLALVAWCLAGTSASAQPAPFAGTHQADAAAAVVPPGDEEPAPGPVLREAIRNAALFAPGQENPGGAVCDGCPRRRVGMALAQVIGINVLYNVVNRFRPDERQYFQVTPKSWWNNLKYGFEWDDNNFSTNQWGHPYQGGNYFNAGRANGLSFWESAPLAALGSFTWEYFGERHRPSLNDLINTTAGGMALGEMLHRAAWLIRDPTKTGKARLWSEIFATVVEPITGANRFASGDASRVSEKPAEFVPSQTVAAFELGVMWRGFETRAVNAAGDPYGQVTLGYGALSDPHFDRPYDAFTLDMRFGGGAGISKATVRGRLYGRPIGAPETSRHEFIVAQAYDYHTNPAYEFGGQSVIAGVLSRFSLSPRSTLQTRAWGGAVLLGAFDSDFGYGTHDQREYDYGPGSIFGVSAWFLRDGLPFLRFSYAGVLVHVVDGADGDHVAQTAQVDGLIPLRKRLKLGVSYEYVRRKAYYHNADDRDSFFPELRVYLAVVSK